MRRVSLILFATLLLAPACVVHKSLPTRTSSFEVRITGSHGTADQPLDFPEQPIPVDVTVKALSNKGGYDTSFNGLAKVYATPGQAQTLDGLTQVTVKLVNGVGTLQADLAGVYGRSFLCVSDALRGPDSTFAAGCSKTFYFQNPSLRQIQEVSSDNTVAPLDGDFVHIDRGDLIVTGITADGFFVSDRTEPAITGLPGNFASIFVYNYNYPDGLQIGDRIQEMTGTIGEFVGDTQVSFPGWTRKDVPTALQDVPAPVEITSAICAATGSGVNGQLCGEDTTNVMMESLESALVVVKNVKTPTHWVDCDYNQDGTVSNYDPTCTANDPRIVCKEIACKVACNQDVNCSELSGFKTYGQWSVAMNGGQGPKINLLTQNGFPEFDPTDPKNQGILIDATGNLTQSLPARPRWIISVRSPSDVVIH